MKSLGGLSDLDAPLPGPARGILWYILFIIQAGGALSASLLAKYPWLSY